jgi:spore maturation protein SpmB
LIKRIRKLEEMQQSQLIEKNLEVLKDNLQLLKVDTKKERIVTMLLRQFSTTGTLSVLVTVLRILRLLL